MAVQPRTKAGHITSAVVPIITAALLAITVGIVSTLFIQTPDNRLAYNSAPFTEASNAHSATAIRNIYRGKAAQNGAVACAICASEECRPDSSSYIIFKARRKEQRAPIGGGCAKVVHRGKYAARWLATDARASLLANLTEIGHRDAIIVKVINP